ncbi:MAG: ABC-type dipeptide/oligopeptide/nickel transport system, permease component [Chloroflexi bacterium]|nr:MAG: ABC-type dipeptide/oligopeptide/nickel transport system, permease component [Chloroflexota bacterium]
MSLPGRAAARAPGEDRGLALERSESPWRRGIRALLKKRIATISLLAILIIYGAGAYTFLDAFGVPTGLQDPNETNLTLRRPTREAETLGTFTERHDVSLNAVAQLNPEVVENQGALTAATILVPGTQLVLRADAALEGPSTAHWFGTDRTGRDMFSRTLFSARAAIVLTVLVFALGSLFLGLGLGLLAGYAGGWVDQVIMRVGDVILAIPGLLVLIVVSAAFREQWTGWFTDFDDFLRWDFFIDQGIDHLSLLILALTFFGWVDTARFVRAQTLSLRESDFILAAESIGARTPRILSRHLFPGILPWVIIGLSSTFAGVVGAEVALTFLGLGVQAPTASFGQMISEAIGIRTFDLHPHLLLVPAIVVAILTFAFNLLGDAVNDVVNPRGR